MSEKSRFRRWLRRPWFWVFSLAATIGIVLVGLYWPKFVPPLSGLYNLLINREAISHYVKSFGAWAPLIFMALQFAQVVLAPIPGEATGFIGGFLFGIAGGTFYSTIALTLGSYTNFLIGRALGKKWVRKTIPPVQLAKMNYLLRHQALHLVFFLFLLPGFPKDYLCLALGISTIPTRVFLLMVLIGRLPGTLMLGIQGALVFEKNYLLLAAIVLFNLIFVLSVYRFRDRLYHWVEKNNNRGQDKID